MTAAATRARRVRAVRGPAWRLHCSKCERFVDPKNNQAEHVSARGLARDLVRCLGWRRTSNGLWVCRECAAKHKGHGR